MNGLRSLREIKSFKAIYLPPRIYKKPEPIYYSFHDQTITVSQCGRVCTKGMKVSLSKAFAGVEVGIKEMESQERIYLR